MEIIRLEEKIAAGYRLGYDEALELMRTTSPGELYELAHRLRTRYQGKRIDTCSIMNARSGRCSEDCKWCAQSKFHKTDIDVYPLVGETEAVQEAAHNASKGVGRFSLVTSGRTLTDAETDRVCAIYRRIGREVPIRLCASLGLLTREQLVKLRESGVEHYHCNMETAPSYFSKLCSTHTPEEKIRTIEWAGGKRRAAHRVCGDVAKNRCRIDSRQRAQPDSGNAACRCGAADRYRSARDDGDDADYQSGSEYPVGRRAQYDQTP